MGFHRLLDELSFPVSANCVIILCNGSHRDWLQSICGILALIFSWSNADRSMNRTSVPVEGGFSWSVEATRCFLFESYMGCQVRRFAVSTKSNQNSRFDKLKESDVQFFKSAVGEKGVLEDKDELAVANIDWMHKYQGHSQILLRPQTTRQVTYIICVTLHSFIGYATVSYISAIILGDDF